MTTTMRDNSEHEILVGTEVLAIYPQGDCDAGTVVALHPDRYFGTVEVRIGRKVQEFLIEDVSMLGMCDDPACESCSFDREYLGIATSK